MRTRWRQTIDRQSIEFGINAEESSFMSDQDAYYLLETAIDYHNERVYATARIFTILMQLDVTETIHDMEDELHAFANRYGK